MENDMVRYLAREGVMPYLLPDLEDKLLQAYLEEADAFVIQGGVDLSPESYNEPFLNIEKWPGDKYRDEFELKVIDYAFKAKKPIYGICRGFQVLNAYFGGTLHQDIQTELDTKVAHRDPDLYDKVNHKITLESNGLLKALYKEEVLNVNSVHHQAVKKLGDKLITDAKSQDDGIIEAFHYDGDQVVIGVQWHPEFSHSLGDKVCDPNVIYNYFLKEVEKLK